MAFGYRESPRRAIGKSLTAGSARRKCDPDPGEALFRAF